MKIKPGVKLQGLQSEMVLALMICEGIYKQHRAEVVVTSARDGKHGKGSRHRVGYAVDLRTRFFTEKGLKARVRDEIAAALGGEFDVILEAEDTPNQHIHVEFDPDS